MIVVTAPTGHIGTRVLAQLLAPGRDEPVRVIARDPEKLPPAVRERVEVVQGSHGDPEVIERALSGADALFWLVPADRRANSIYDAYVGFALPAAAAIVQNGVQHIVSVSALGRGTQLYAGHASATIAMDDLLASTGAHLRALANGSFIDNLERSVASIRDDGVIRGTQPADVKRPLVATADIADAAVRLLVDRGWSGQQTVDLLGPEDLSPNDQAAILSEVLGRPVRYELGDRNADKRAMLGFGMSEAVAQALVDMDIAKENGLDSFVTRTPHNTTPTSLRQWATEVLKPAVEGR